MSQQTTRELVDELKSHGINVIVYACDIGEEEKVKKMIEFVQGTMPPIRGVLHGAMVLKDILFEKASVDDWNVVVKARVQGAWNLHRGLLGTELDFFIMLASISGIIGSRGQAAYAASNTFMDAFAEYRMQQGLTASAIDIGVVTGVGYMAEHMPLEARNSALIHDSLNEKELLAVVKAAINFNPKDASSHQTITGCKLLPDEVLPWWAANPRFSHIVRGTQDTTDNVAKKDKTVSIRDSLKQVLSRAQLEQIIQEALIGKIASVSMTPREDVDPDKSMAVYGMDSLVAVEVRNWIANQMAANVSALEFIASTSIAGLTQAVINRSTLIDQSAISALATE